MSLNLLLLAFHLHSARMKRLREAAFTPAMLRCRGPCPFTPSTPESGERIPAKVPTELLQATAAQLDSQSLGALRLTCKGVREGVEILFKRSLRELKNIVLPPRRDIQPGVKQIQRLLELSGSEYAGEVRTLEWTFLPTHSLVTDWKSPDCKTRGLEDPLTSIFVPVYGGVQENKTIASKFENWYKWQIILSSGWFKNLSTLKLVVRYD
ncbi:hypothetical protein HDK77DRAFT_5565 [Phyllosticta capitalensis]